MIQPGTVIPDFLGYDQNGAEVRRSNFPGKKIALYFYPKDMTPGCTAQACNLRDNYDNLLNAGVQPIGVSIDSPERHQKFIEKNQIPFPLISDQDHKLVEHFGVWGEKKLAGRTYMGTLRTTFIIAPDGTVERVITPREVKTKDHAAQII